MVRAQHLHPAQTPPASGSGLRGSGCLRGRWLERCPQPGSGCDACPVAGLLMVLCAPAQGFQAICESIRDCVQCQAWGTGNRKGNCSTCHLQVQMVEELKKGTRTQTRVVCLPCACVPWGLLMLGAGFPVLVTPQPGDRVPNLSTEEASEQCSFQDEEDDCTYHYTLMGDPSDLPNATVQVQKKKGEQAREVESSVLREQHLW